VDSYLNVFVRGMRTFDLKFECLNQFFPSQLMHIGSKQHSFRVSYYSSSLTTIISFHFRFQEEVSSYGSLGTAVAVQ
jgi:hypothetical protein